MIWDLLCCYEIVASFKQGLTWAVLKIRVHVVVVCGSNMEKLNIVICYAEFFVEQNYKIVWPCYRRFMDNKKFKGK